MEKTVYIHIGAHKTATTSVQSYLSHHAPRLASNGILYPDTCRYHFGHHRIGFALKEQIDPSRQDRPEFETEIAELRREIDASTAHTVIVSSEALFVLPQHALDRLKQALTGYHVEVIAFVRRQDSYLVSLYNQLVQGADDTFTAPLSDFVENPRSIAREISFAPHIERWQNTFGRVHLFRLEDASPIDALFPLIGAQMPDNRPIGRTNASPPAAVINLILWCKRIGIPFRIRMWIRALATRLLFFAPAVTLSDADRNKILLEFAEENDRLFQSFGMENTYGPLTRTTVKGSSGPDDNAPAK